MNSFVDFFLKIRIRKSLIGKMSKFKFRDLKITVKMGGDDGSSSVRELSVGK